jgi:hypothetical protein
MRRASAPTSQAALTADHRRRWSASWIASLQSWTRLLLLLVHPPGTSNHLRRRRLSPSRRCRPLAVPALLQPLRRNSARQ